MYNISQYFTEILKERFQNIQDVSLRYEKISHNGKIRFEPLRVKQNKFTITDENKDLLGFNAPKQIHRNTTSHKSAHILKYSNLYVHVDQINIIKWYYS